MQLLSIHTGKVQTHDHNGEAWTSGYKKQPVTGSVRVHKLNVEGDQQHHTKFHGGEHRAVLMYGAEHYDWWRDQMGYDLPYGAFAENFTVSGISEETACLGDIYQIGEEVRLQVSQPRFPCDQIYKALGIEGIVNQVKESRRSGWYLRVLVEGSVSAGIPVTLLERPYPDWNLVRTIAVMTARAERREEALELSGIAELEPTWRQRLADIGKKAGSSHRKKQS